MRGGDKRTIDLLSSVDLEVRVRRDHLARAIRTIGKGPSMPERELGAHYSAMRPSIRRSSCWGRRCCKNLTRFDRLIRIDGREPMWRCFKCESAGSFRSDATAAVWRRRDDQRGQIGYVAASPHHLGLAEVAARWVLRPREGGLRQ